MGLGRPCPFSTDTCWQIVEGNDLFGDGVILAARLESIAEPGSIFVSRSVRDQVRGKLTISFENVGPRLVKNVKDPIQVYQVSGTRPPPSRTMWSSTDALALPAKPSIAVLPFTNMSGDPDQQYFSDGVTEDIITELSRFRLLFVISRNSSFRYREAAVDVQDVGRKLGVSYVLEGSVRRAAQRIRITAQLIEAATNRHVWADRYDRGIDDLFEVQDDVTRTIVATLVGRLEDTEIRGSGRKPTENLQAYDLLLKGIQLLRGYGAEDNRRARELFERAVELDERFALAHAYLALSLVVEHGYAAAPNSTKQRALDIAHTAVRLDPEDGRCHQYAALVHLYREEFEICLSHYERAVALNPNDANGLSQFGLALTLAGRANEGIQLIRRAMRLNPFHPDWYWDDLAVALYGARQYDEAAAVNLRLTAHKKPWFHARLAACYFRLGRLEEARAQAAEVMRLRPDFRISSVKLVYKDPRDGAHVVDAMHMAGIPQ
jgi:adenylate cyclase